jgi:hypothetical protein
MANKASNHIVRCNIATCEAHNDRTEEYMKHIKKEDLYIIQERTPHNIHWRSGQMQDMKLEEYMQSLRELYKSKFGYYANEKDRTMVSKKTGKTRTVAGWSPIREGVVNIKASTTIEDLQNYAEVCRQKYGIAPIRIDIHKDEGHPQKFEPDVPEDEKVLLQDGRWLKLNLHAHVVYDWVNHETGKTYKCDEKVMADIQTLAAECLGMERGKKKSETGREHLSREEFIAQKLMEQKAELTADIEELEDEKARKQEDVNNAQADLLHQGIGAVGGMMSDWVSGKNAKKNKEVEKVKADNERLTKERDEAKEQAKTADERAKTKYQTQFDQRISKLQESYAKQVNDAVDKQTAELKKERVDAIEKFNELLKENEKTYRDYQNLKIKLSTRDDVLTVVAKMLWNLIAPAIKAIIDLALNRDISYASEFIPQQAAKIKEILEKFSDDPAKQQSIAYWLLYEADKRNNFTDKQYQQCDRELERIVRDQYSLNQSNGKWKGY